jgi:hypothetical protein
MSKKKGLGKDIIKSVDVMDNLLLCLTSFHDIPVKRGLKSNEMLEDDISKAIDITMNKAFELKTLVSNLKDQIEGAKPKASARFAGQRVISKFLSIEN